MITADQQTLIDLTELMNKYEVGIALMNQKYNYNIETASSKEQLRYRTLFAVWEELKKHRDEFKQTLFNQSKNLA